MSKRQQPDQSADKIFIWISDLISSMVKDFVKHLKSK